MTDHRYFLRRAIEAEEKLERAQERVVDLERRLRASLNADATTASQALSWVSRAEAAEKLLAELMHYINQRSIETGHFPPGWVASAQAQLKAVEILKRDLDKLAERPSEEDYWTMIDDPKAGRTVGRNLDRPVVPNFLRNADGSRRR